MESREETYEDVSKEENPFEPGPAHSSTCRAILGTKPTALNAVVVFIVGAWHPGFATAEGLDTTSKLWDTEAGWSTLALARTTR